MYVFFFTILLVPVITHKSHVMSAHPCLQVHDCISACPCFLSCMFACPCLHGHVHVCMSMAASLLVHVCMSMSACPCLRVCMSMPASVHAASLHVHVCISACPCLHAHVFMSMSASVSMSKPSTWMTYNQGSFTPQSSSKKNITFRINDP